MSGILVIDDERAMRETLAYNLRHAGYDVRLAGDGPTGLAAARAQRPDLILLDVLLPGGMDGFDVCRALRTELRCPIVMISARADEVDRVVGLEVGADDYVTKPFSIVELMARIKARLRRTIPDPSPGASESPTRALGAPRTRIAVGPISVDPLRREVRVHGREIDLKRREFDLLHYLARHAGTTLSRTRLLSALWPEELQSRHGTRTVDVCVYRLREKIEPDPERPRFIHTVRGLGYVLRAPLAAINVPLKTA